MSDDLKDNEESIIAGKNSSMISFVGRSTGVSIGNSSTSMGCEEISSCSGSNLATTLVRTLPLMALVLDLQ